MTENIKIYIEELRDEELFNQPYDFSSPIFDDEPSQSTNKKIIPSVLSKRKFEDAFDSETFDDERYQQHISNNYFENSTGHSVHYEVSNKTVINSIYDLDELLDWCNKYLASKKKL